MRKVFYLKTCGTCLKILKELDLSNWELRELKSKPLTEEELAQMYTITNSYEALFSRRSTQIKARNIALKDLEEKDFKALLLDHYSFLKRPVFIKDKDIFIGSDKATVAQLTQYFENK